MKSACFYFFCSIQLASANSRTTPLRGRVRGDGVASQPSLAWLWLQTNLMKRKKNIWIYKCMSENEGTSLFFFFFLFGLKTSSSISRSHFPKYKTSKNRQNLISTIFFFPVCIFYPAKQMMLNIEYSLSSRQVWKITLSYNIGWEYRTTTVKILRYVFIFMLCSTDTRWLLVAIFMSFGMQGNPYRFGDTKVDPHWV